MAGRLVRGISAKDVDDVWQGEGLLLEELLGELANLLPVLLEQGLARVVALVDDAVDLLVDQAVRLLGVILLVSLLDAQIKSTKLWTQPELSDHAVGNLGAFLEVIARSCRNLAKENFLGNTTT